MENLPGKKELISIVLPAMNEEENIPLCHKALSDVLDKLDVDYEVLVIDNDSTDNTPVVCTDICARDDKWRYIKLSKNFSGENSVAAGLQYADGDAVIIFLSDLQEPAELIPVFIEKWRQGYDIVYGINVERPDDSFLKKMMVSFFYRTINLLADLELPKHASEYRLMDRKVVLAIRQLKERNRYLRGLVHWIGFKKQGVEYRRIARKYGRSKMPLGVLFNYAIRSITVFSTKPLRLFMIGGLSVMLLAMLLIVIYFTLYLTIGSKAYGIITVVLLLLANIGLTAFGIGVLGEYIGHIYERDQKASPMDCGRRCKH